ncbi:hypothetical protein SAMN05421840_10242 [Shewanella morhuae]|nr:hypothetical protein SAMN05421840_10242 [Shewanella morhuae]
MESTLWSVSHACGHNERLKMLTLHCEHILMMY